MHTAEQCLVPRPPTREGRGPELEVLIPLSHVDHLSLDTPFRHNLLFPQKSTSGWEQDPGRRQNGTRETPETSVLRYVIPEPDHA